jgi:hypothetical protein
MSNSENKPSGNTLLKTTLITLVAAVIVTVLFVMPAEFGIDPTGVGAQLGLLDLSAIDSSQEQSDDSDSAVNMIEGTYPGIPDEFDLYEPDVLGAPFSTTHDKKYRSDTLTINLELGEEVEYKAVMQQGDAILYSWQVASGDVYTDFHADPGEAAEGYPESYFIRYRESETGSSNGSLVAPFDGNHGWYWLNIQENAIEITLEIHGYYDSVSEVYRGMQ